MLPRVSMVMKGHEGTRHHVSIEGEFEAFEEHGLDGGGWCVIVEPTRPVSDELYEAKMKL